MQKLVCWSCGASLKDVPQPFTRLEQCKSCRADLHVCRLCRFYNPGISEKCDHDMAEPARDPAVANFCHYFRPRTNAFTQDKKSQSDEALEKLRALFDETSAPPAADSNTDTTKSDYGTAKDKFDSLFKDDK